MKVITYETTKNVTKLFTETKKIGSTAYASIDAKYIRKLNQEIAIKTVLDTNILK